MKRYQTPFLPISPLPIFRFDSSGCGVYIISCYEWNYFPREIHFLIATSEQH